MLDDAPPVIAVLGDPCAAVGPRVAMVGGRNASANGQRMAETLAADSGPQRRRGVRPGARHRRRGACRRARHRPHRRRRRRRPGPALPARACCPASAGSPRRARWSPRPRSAPPRRPAISRAATASSPVCRSAWWWWRRRTRSGSLITARIAQEVGREVFAVPGSPTDPRSRGANDLLRQGAILTETAADVLDNLPQHPMLPPACSTDGRAGAARTGRTAPRTARRFARPSPRPDRKCLICLALRQQRLTMWCGAASSLPPP